MLANVFTKTIWDNRRAWLGWAVAVGAVAAMYASFWPSIGANAGLADMMKSFPDSLKEAFHLDDIATPAGYLGANTFGILVPLLLTFFGISAGVKAMAADEESGTMDLILAHPVSRTRLALQRFAAIAGAVVLICATVCVVVLALRGPAQLTPVAPGNIAAICLQLALFGILWAAVAYAVGTITGKRGPTIGASSGLAVLAYVADSFLPQVKALKWTEKLSPFDWYLGGEPLKHGVQWGHCALLLAVSAVLVAVGTWAFNRRDLAV